MYLRHAILHKVAEDAAPQTGLYPGVQSWLDEKRKAGEQQYMEDDSILEMITADKAVKDSTASRDRDIQTLNNLPPNDPRRAMLQNRIAAYDKRIAENSGVVDTFNKRRALRKEHGVTSDFYQRERGHEQRALRAASNAFMKTLTDAGYSPDKMEFIPPEVREKAKQAAKAAGDEYVKGRLGFLSDREAADIQRYSQYNAAAQQQGLQPQPFQYNDPNFQKQLGQLAMSYGMSEMGPMEAAKRAVGNFGSGANPADTAYQDFMGRMHNEYTGATQNMQQRFSDERAGTIKKWAPWVIGGGALLTGALAGFGAGKDKEEPKDPWTSAQENEDRMAWTKNSYRDASRNPSSAQAPKSPFGTAFRDFMSQNPFARA